MDIAGILVNLVSGVIGGNVIGAAWKDKSLGAIGNTIAGAVGGVAGNFILQLVGVLTTLGVANMPISSLATKAGAAAVFGAVLTGIVGLIKSKVSNKR